MTKILPPLALALALLPQLATACIETRDSLWFCERGTHWEHGTWEQGGDSAVLRSNGLALEWYRQWIGRHLSKEGDTLEQDFAVYQEWIDENRDAPVKVLLADKLTTQHATALRQITRENFFSGPALHAVMLLEADGKRLMVTVDGPPDMPLDEMEKASRSVFALWRTTCADGVSCADPE